MRLNEFLNESQIQEIGLGKALRAAGRSAGRATGKLVGGTALAAGGLVGGAAGAWQAGKKGYRAGYRAVSGEEPPAPGGQPAAGLTAAPLPSDAGSSAGAVASGAAQPKEKFNEILRFMSTMEPEQKANLIKYFQDELNKLSTVAKPTRERPTPAEILERRIKNKAVRKI